VRIIFFSIIPDIQLIFRSVSQLAQMTDEELRALFAEAPMPCWCVAVFGDAAMRLQDLHESIRDFPVILAIHSVQSSLSCHCPVIGMGFCFKMFGEDQLQKLSRNPPRRMKLWMSGSRRACGSLSLARNSGCVPKVIGRQGGR
jgi:hypothetical protein